MPLLADLLNYSTIFKTIHNPMIKHSNTFIITPGDDDFLPLFETSADIHDDPLETIYMNMTEENKKSFYKLYNNYCKLDNFDKFSEI